MTQEDLSKQFVMQFARHEHELFRYVLTLVPNWNDAQDVMQETAAALWQKFEEFNSERAFLPWACQFAYFQVLNFRRRQATRRLLFSDAVVEALAAEWPAEAATADARLEALERCLGKLSAHDHELVRLRYATDEDVGALAERTGQTPNALYKALQRIRRMLLDCVTRTLAAEGLR